MKKTIFSLLFAGLSLSALSQAVETEQNQTETIAPKSFGHIDTEGLRALIDSQTAFILFDARGNKWNDNNVIAGAILASYEYENEELEALAPNKDSLIVVYCYSTTCPLSKRLALKLLDLGYENVIEYPEGLKVWRDTNHYPTDTLTR